MQISKSAAVVLAVIVAAFIFAAPRLGFYGFAASDPPMGAKCVVSIRRDSQSNPSVMSVNGTLKSVSRDWIVVDTGGKDTWIPRSSVMLVELL